MIRIINGNLQIKADDDTKIRLIDVKLNKNSSGYYLSLVYEIETPESVKRLTIPYAGLRISQTQIDIDAIDLCFSRDYYFNMMSDKLPLYDGGNGAAYTLETIKTKTKEMTLEEIEKKLGHKIKLVTKKGTTK